MRQFFDAAVKPAAGSAAGGAPRFNVVRGERPDTWLYIHGPTHERTTTLRREAARLLPAAEAFNAFAAGALDDGSFRNYPTADLNRAWLDELYIDHGIGGKNGHITDEVFHQKVVAARDTAAGTLGNALRRIAGAVETRPTLGEPVVVFNTLSWARSAPVEVELNDHRPLTTPFTVTDAAGEIVPAQLSFVDAPTERNVALATAGATATASSQFSADYAPAKAIDGRWSVQNPHPEVGESHKWNSAATAGTAAAGTAPHWLALDLGRERVISKIVLRHEGTVGSFNGEPRTATHSAFNTRDFRLQYADAAGGPWRDLCAPVTGNTAAHTAHRFPPTRARHLRVLIEKPNSLPNDDAARLYEFEAYERDADIAAAENLARLPGVKATASSRFNAQYDAGAVVDGKWSVRDPRSRRERSHKWNSAPSTGTDTGGTPAGNKANGGLAGPHWLALDLGARRAVARVVLRHEGANEGGDGHSANTRDFRIQCADAAGGPWRDLAVVTGNTAAVSEHRFPAVETRHLRVLITRPSQHGDRYARLYEFEAYAPAPPATPRRAKLVFVAKDVPAFGYRTYYVQKAGSSQAGGVHATTRSPLPAPLSLLPTFENAFYRLTLAPGGIASLYEKQQRRELLATGDGPRELRAAEPFTLLSVPPNKRGAGTDAGEFGCTPKPVLDGTYARVAPDQGFPFFARHRLLETGPVREVWGYAVPWVNGTTAVQRITLWRDLPQIDIAIELRDFDGEFWREFRLAFPLALRDPKITYEVPFGTVTVGEDEIRGTGGHAYGRLNYSEPCAAVRPRENQNFIDASDAAGGLTLTATTAVFDWLSPFDPAFAKDAPPPPAGSERTAAGGAAGAADAGGGAAGSAAKSAFPVTLQPVLLASRKSCNGAGNWYPQTGTHTYRFALTPHTGDWRNSWRAATAANHPLVPVLAAATTGATAATAATSLPEVHSFLTLRDAAGAVVSAVKKAEDADALAIRLVEMTGTPARPTLVFPRPHTLTPTNILE
ncbi:MAG: discoidin domain-containing protein [Puniceicoccales bacterium]|nr:discoidin domain-containing protein [Puniceicoccales bacterium]